MSGMQVISGKKPRKNPKLRVSFSHKLRGKKKIQMPHTMPQGLFLQYEQMNTVRALTPRAAEAKINFPGQWRVPLWKSSLPSVCLLY